MFLLFAAFCLSIHQVQTSRFLKNKKHIAGSNPRNRGDSILCNICTDIVTQIEQLLEDKQVEEEILEYILQYCQKLPSPYSSLCGAYIEQGISLVISYIEQGLESLDICVKLSLCETTKAKKIRAEPQAKPIRTRSSIPNDGFISCTICKEALSFVKRQLEKEKVQEHITILVTGLCDHIPIEYQEQCKSLATDYIPLALKLIYNELNADELCTNFGLCATQAKLRPVRRPNPLRQEKYVPVTPIALPPNYVKATGCDMCNKIMAYIKNLLADEKLEDEITQRITKLCTAFADPYSSVCQTLVEEYLPIIIVWVQGEISAADICEKTGLC